MSTSDTILAAIEAAEILQREGLGHFVEDADLEAARQTLSQHHALIISGAVVLDTETNRVLVLYGGEITNKSSVATMMAGFQIDPDKRVGTMVVHENETPVFERNQETRWELIGDESIAAYIVEGHLIVGADVTTFDNLMSRGYLAGLVAYDTTPQTGYYEVEALVYFEKVDNLEEDELFRWYWEDYGDLPADPDEDDDEGFIEVEYETLTIELDSEHHYTDDEIMEIVEVIEEELAADM